MLTFRSHNDALPPVSVDPAGIVATPRGRAARLAQAALEALPVAMAARERWLSQLDVEPVVVVAAADSDIGRSIIEARRPGAAQELTGPLVFALTAAELASVLGPKGQRVVMGDIEALAAQPGEAVFCFAVNGNLLDFRAMRVGPAAAPTAEPEPV